MTRLNAPSAGVPPLSREGEAYTLNGVDLITARRLTVRYGNTVTSPPILDELDFEATSQAVAITGPSGSGKSTLLRVLSGLQRPTSGGIFIDGAPVRYSRAGTVDPRVSVVYQDFRLVDFLNLGDNLKIALALRQQPCTTEETRRALSTVGIEKLAGRRPADISGGEQQRAAIARALVTKSRIVIADEPTGSLDPINSEAVGRLLAKLATAQGLTVIVATHDSHVSSFMSASYRVESGKLTRER